MNKKGLKILARIAITVGAIALPLLDDYISSKEQDEAIKEAVREEVALLTKNEEEE